MTNNKQKTASNIDFRSRSGKVECNEWKSCEKKKKHVITIDKHSQAGLRWACARATECVVIKFKSLLVNCEIFLHGKT